MRLRLLTLVALLVAPLLLAAPAAAEVSIECAAGTFSTTGNEPCTTAEPGTFVELQGQTSATPCPVGKFQPDSGQVECLNADIGFYVDSTGSNSQTACPDGFTTGFEGAASATACDVSIVTDSDGDGVADIDDLCPGTTLPEDTAQKNRYRADGEGAFVDGRGDSSGLTVADTGGCSAAQIIEAAGLGKGHVKHGLSIGALRNWVDSLA